MSFMRSVMRGLKGLNNNFPGWRSSRKIIVFESDDWGSIRMPSKETYQKCLKAGYQVDKKPYERYDSLASEDDLELLFDVLHSYKDVKGEHPIITANCVVANPDFEKIREDEFTNYHYELITKTFDRYPNHRNCIDLWKSGLTNKVFFPQYHGREHLNVNLFMKDLRSGNEDAIFAFNNKMPGITPKDNYSIGNLYIEATNYRSESDKNLTRNILIDGLKLFYEIFDYHSESMIPTNYIWSPDFDESMSLNGIKYYQGVRKFREPGLTKKDTFYSNYLGKKNQYNQIYLLRNCSFEPTINPFTDSVSDCLADIALAFILNKPAIISTHRLNFIGFIDESNRDNNLKLLSDLLKRIVMRWPTVEFMNSAELGRTINNEFPSQV